METMLLLITVYAAAAVVAVPLSQRLGLGSVLGYLAAGIAIGPLLSLIGPQAKDLMDYAEFGVVLMLFLIGLELEPKSLWEMRRRFFGLGGLQVGATLAAVAAICLGLGLPWNQALAIGMILCLSSTAIVMQTLSEKRLTRTEGGRASFAVLLFQDIAAIPFLALLPLLAYRAGVQPHTGDIALLGDVAGWVKALMVLAAAGAVILAGRFLSQPFFHFIDWANLHEIYVAAALMFVAGTALGMSVLGLSPALGSFLAGVVLANSPYRHELESDIAPFKGLLLGLFFIAVGASIDLSLLADRPLRILALTLALMALKLAVLFAVARLFGLRGRERMLFTLALAQAGEFGFFLLAFAAQTRVLPADMAGVILVVISMSMVLTPALFLLYDRLSPLLAHAIGAPEVIDEQGTVIVAGMGRFGQTVNRLVAGLGHKTVVIDNHADTVASMRRLGIKAFYGDVGRFELLAAAGIAEARALVIAIDDPDKSVRLVRHVRRRYPRVAIIARARDRRHVYALRHAGATDTVREVFDGAVHAGELALTALGYEKPDIARIASTFLEHDEHMLAELAPLWHPFLSPEQNRPYLEKEREQYETIAAALRGRDAPAAEPVAVPRP